VKGIFISFKKYLQYVLIMSVSCTNPNTYIFQCVPKTI